MDEAFWSNVVKRWSEASETVIKLKIELAKAHEDRELYRDVVQNLRKTGGIGETSGSRSRLGHTRQESGRTIVGDEDHASSLRDELKDAENGLVRAKEEYRRLQKELTEASEKIQALSSENAELVSIQREVAAAQEERRQILTLNKELEDARLENQDLHNRVRELEQEINEINGRFDSDRTPTIETLPMTLKSFGHQIEMLKESLHSKEEENNELKNDLEIAEEKFIKAEDRNKAMMKSIIKLQDITRHSTSSLRNLSPNYLASSPRPRKVSLMSNSNRSGLLERVENDKRASTSSAPAATVSSIEDVTMIGFSPGNLLSSYGGLPDDRGKALLKLPIAEIKEVASSNSFDREFLKGVLGSLVERSSENQITEDKKLSTISYLCPTLNHHPWCPSLPGQHGYIFVGLGKEKETYKSPVVRNLFVGLPKDQNRQRRFRYLGKYRVVRVRSLSLDEWNSLTNDAKLMYARLTKEKTRDSHSTEEIFDTYDRGDVSVPCVMLQHLSFDEQLFDTLVSHLQRDSGRRT